MHHIDWVTHLERSPSGVPRLAPAFVARRGRGVRVVDVRGAEEVLGPLGHVPGCDWIPADEWSVRIGEIDRDQPLILVSRAGERSEDLAQELEATGLRYVASMRGGMLAWRAAGYRARHDGTILERRGQLRPPPKVDAPADGELTREDVEAHLGDPAEIVWVKLASLLLQATRSCVDGRGDMGILGTPGGDAGELVLALHALERFVGRRLSHDVLTTLVERAASAMGSLYMHTDTHARERLVAALDADPELATADLGDDMDWWRWLSSPPPEHRARVLEQLLKPEHVGCGHLRLMLEHRDDYGVRGDLVRDVITAFTELRWRGVPELDLVVLPGGHKEAGVFDVTVEGVLHGTSEVPLIAPSCPEGQVFVNHPQVATYVRTELAAVLADQGDLVPVAPEDAPTLARLMDLMGQEHAQKTLAFLGSGLPMFSIHFDRSGRYEVREMGMVGD